MSNLRTRSEEAHRKQVEFTIADIAKFLQDALGQKLVAYMANVSDSKTVSQWISHAHQPRPESEVRLRAAFQVFHLLQDEESPHTVRAWLIGMNPQLEDVSPAQAIRDGRLEDVWVAAKAYMAGG
jgi:nicotinamide mononucleotide adenylyltransferase